MAILDILHFPNPNLRNKAHSIDLITPVLKQNVTDMLETMYASRGIGLAAIQVGLKKRIVVMDVSEQQNEPQVFINPIVIKSSGEEKHHF